MGVVIDRLVHEMCQGEDFGHGENEGVASAVDHLRAVQQLTEGVSIRPMKCDLAYVFKCVCVRICIRMLYVGPTQAPNRQKGNVHEIMQSWTGSGNVSQWFCKGILFNFSVIPDSDKSLGLVAFPWLPSASAN